MSQSNAPQIDFSKYADWLRSRAGRFTAGPPQLLSQYGIQLEDWRIKPIASIYGLAELTGVPTLYRWWQAILQNKPISEVEREYFQRIAKELQQAGVNANEQTLATRINQATMQGVLTALPLAVPLSRAEAAALAKALGAGFGFVGGPTAIIRAEQGHREEALRAFIETGLAGTALADLAASLRSLAAGIAPERLGAVRQQILRQQRQLAQWRDPEGEAFMKQIEEALLALKQGDTSKYDSLLKQFDEWQKTISEFNKLYELKQKGQLTPEDEARYTKLLQEVAKIKDKYDWLKAYIESARELELRTRQQQFESRTVEDLAKAAGEMPPGPPPRDWFERLQKMDVDLLHRIVQDPRVLSRYARRFGVDEQTLAERAALLLRERQWENLAKLPQEELRRILMDRNLLKKYATELGVDEEKLMAAIEQWLQGRSRLTSPEPPEAAKPPELPKPPEGTTPPRPPELYRPPELEVEPRRGQVQVVRVEGRPTVERLDILPPVEARLRYLLRRRGRPTDERILLDWERIREEMQRTTGRDRDRATTEQARDTDKTTGTTPDRTRDDTTHTPDRTTDTTPGKTTTDTQKVTERVVEREVVVLDRNTLRMFIPALPVTVFVMPAASVLAFISRAVGAPVTLPPDVPRPLPRENFGSWLDRVFSGTGFTWRSLAAQREAFVFA